MQAELTGLTEGAKLCIQNNINRRNIIFCSDSQAALKAVSRGTVKSYTALDCINKMNELVANHNTVFIYWIPGHKGHLGNELADSYAGKGTEKADVDIRTKCTGRLRDGAIEKWSNLEATKKWVNSKKAVHTKLFIPTLDKNRAADLLKLSRKELRIFCNFVTGHNCLREHLNRIGKSDDTLCRHCMEDFVENSKHVLCECEAFTSTRLKVFGEHFLSPGKLSKLKTEEVLRFIRISQLGELIAQPYATRQN